MVSILSAHGHVHHEHRRSRDQLRAPRGPSLDSHAVPSSRHAGRSGRGGVVACHRAVPPTADRLAQAAGARRERAARRAAARPGPAAANGGAPGAGGAMSGGTTGTGGSASGGATGTGGGATGTGGAAAAAQRGPVAVRAVGRRERAGGDARGSGGAGGRAGAFGRWQRARAGGRAAGARRERAARAEAHPERLSPSALVCEDFEDGKGGRLEACAGQRHEIIGTH